MSFAFLWSFGTFPVATGIAILKYRLFEVDLIIDRTLVYGSLTAILAVVYFGGVATQTISPRRKCDAAKTLDALYAKLRDETNLDALGVDLAGVVRETVQPAHVSLWLRPETAPKGEPATVVVRMGAGVAQNSFKWVECCGPEQVQGVGCAEQISHESGGRCVHIHVCLRSCGRSAGDDR